LTQTPASVFESKPVAEINVHVLTVGSAHGFGVGLSVGLVPSVIVTVFESVCGGTHWPLTQIPASVFKSEPVAEINVHVLTVGSAHGFVVGLSVGLVPSVIVTVFESVCGGTHWPFEQTPFATAPLAVDNVQVLTVGSLHAFVGLSVGLVPSVIVTVFVCAGTHCPFEQTPVVIKPVPVVSVHCVTAVGEALAHTFVVVGTHCPFTHVPARSPTLHCNTPPTLGDAHGFVVVGTVGTGVEQMTQLQADGNCVAGVSVEPVGHWPFTVHLTVRQGLMLQTPFKHVPLCTPPVAVVTVHCVTTVGDALAHGLVGVAVAVVGAVVAVELHL